MKRNHLDADVSSFAEYLTLAFEFLSPRDDDAR